MEEVAIWSSRLDDAVHQEDTVMWPQPSTGQHPDPHTIALQGYATTTTSGAWSGLREMGSGRGNHETLGKEN
jgi:hypothetical protein